jgi:hypothetical protein
MSVVANNFTTVVVHDGISKFGKTLESLFKGKIIAEKTVVVRSDKHSINMKKIPDNVSVIDGVGVGKGPKSLVTMLDCIASQEGSQGRLLLVLGGVIYPRHLLQHYINNIQTLEADLVRQMTEKKVDYNGVVFGISGLTMVSNRKENIVKNTTSLLKHTNPFYVQRNQCGWINSNATMDILELRGSVLIDAKILTGFTDYVRKITLPDTITEAEAADYTSVLLSNFLANKNVMRTQICNIELSRLLLEHFDSFQKEPKHSNDNDKNVSLVKIIQNLYEQNMFYLWKDPMNINL